MISEGVVVKVLLCSQGVVPDAQVIFVFVELSPRASTTPPLGGSASKALLILEHKSVEELP
jgi:hypothetical protein